MDLMVYRLLERIADAFEEQNRQNAEQNAEWIVMQTKWRHKDREDDVGKQIVAIHERNAEREQEWIQEQRKMLVEHLEREHVAYLEVLREEMKRKIEGTSA